MSNVDTARSAYEAFGRGDLAALQEIVRRGRRLGHLGRAAARRRSRRAATRSSANFAQIPNYWTSFSVEPEEFIDAGEYVVVRGTQRAGNDKGSFEAPFVHLLEVRRDGKTVRGEFFTDSAKAAKACLTR